MIGLFTLLAGCHRPPSPPAPAEPLPDAPFRAAEAAAAARVPDPARGGPPLHPAQAPLPPFTGVDRATARYVGAERCLPCHPAAAAAWRASSHARGLATLVEAGRAHDPRCLRCHVTGYAHPGAWPSRPDAPRPPGVGCEACHGPGSGHLAAPDRPYGELPRDLSACVACHTHDQSPTFRFETGWPSVAHGR